MASPFTVKEISAHYGERALVELPAIAEFARLGWQTANLQGETFGPDGTEGRESESQVILAKRLRAALVRLNPDLPPDAYTQALAILTEDRSKQIPVNANRDFYRLLRDRVKVTIPDDDGIPETVALKIIDWDHPANNEFFLAQQLWVSGDMYRRRCDLVGFVNGIPLVFIELKAPHVPLKSAFDDNLRDYRGQSIPQLFHANAFILLSNGKDTKVGTLTAEWEHFFEWKRIDDEGEPGSTRLETALRGLCEPGRLLDIVENFTLFEEVRGGLVKKVAKNHQYLGVNKAIAKVEQLREADSAEARRLGVYWHTQGSGKSLSMVFFTQKIFRKLPGNWTFVIVTDRDELDGQIYKTFTATGAVTGAEVQAISGEHLKQLLAQDHRYVFTLIQKFRTEKSGVYPQLSDRRDIIVITDEAHRSQYDIFALNMRSALPNAAFLGFTGTPLIQGEEERTREVFGDYVSVYDFARSIEDGATVPLYYENRIPELQLTNENLNGDLARLLEDAELDAEQEKKLEREFAREYHLITREDRLGTVAEDVVRHFLGRGYRGKAMMVCIDKATAVRMYDKVRAHWRRELQKTRVEWKEWCRLPGYVIVGDPQESPEWRHEQALIERLNLLEKTDMAVIVSQAQNEVEDLKKKGLDIKPHRERMQKEHLDEKFKDPGDPLGLVFVCAMWITGFDVPTCSTLYLDKPMKNHTLMQTIARANRVAPGKTAGLIVDYAGIFCNLERALAIYAQPARPGASPIRDKAALVERLKALLTQAEGFCRVRGIGLVDIAAADPGQRLPLLNDAVDILIAKDEDKKAFLQLASNVARVFKAILPDTAANAYAPLAVLVAYLGAMIKALTPQADISELMGDIEALLNDSIATEGYRIGATPKAEPLIDLSVIDFEKLQKKFAEGRKRTETEKLKGQIQRKLNELVQLNHNRIDFLEKFQQLIEAYNAGSRNLEDFFKELMAFTRQLTDEEKRAQREGLTEEQLAVFDILTRPDPVLTDKEKDEVKKVAGELLTQLKANKLVLDWRKKPQSSALVRKTIRDALNRLPAPYTRDIKKAKADLTYCHIYDSYFGPDQSIYQASAQTSTN
jgi:type I restriction enzyme R subunit